MEELLLYKGADGTIPNLLKVYRLALKKLIKILVFKEKVNGDCYHAKKQTRSYSRRLPKRSNIQVELKIRKGMLSEFNQGLELSRQDLFRPERGY